MFCSTEPDRTDRDCACKRLSRALAPCFFTHFFFPRPRGGGKQLSKSTVGPWSPHPLARASACPPPDVGPDRRRGHPPQMEGRTLRVISRKGTRPTGTLVQISVAGKLRQLPCAWVTGLVQLGRPQKYQPDSGLCAPLGRCDKLANAESKRFCACNARGNHSPGIFRLEKRPSLRADAYSPITAT